MKQKIKFFQLNRLLVLTLLAATLTLTACRDVLGRTPEDPAAEIVTLSDFWGNEYEGDILQKDTEYIFCRSDILMQAGYDKDMLEKGLTGNGITSAELTEIKNHIYDVTGRKFFEPNEKDEKGNDIPFDPKKHIGIVATPDIVYEIERETMYAGLWTYAAAPQ